MENARRAQACCSGLLAEWCHGELTTLPPRVGRPAGAGAAAAGAAGEECGVLLPVISVIHGSCRACAAVMRLRWGSQGAQELASSPLGSAWAATNNTARLPAHTALACPTSEGRALRLACCSRDPACTRAAPGRRATGRARRGPQSGWAAPARAASTRPAVHVVVVG